MKEHLSTQLILKRNVSFKEYLIKFPKFSQKWKFIEVNLIYIIVCFLLFLFCIFGIISQVCLTTITLVCYLKMFNKGFLLFSYVTTEQTLFAHERPERRPSAETQTSRYRDLTLMLETSECWEVGASLNASKMFFSSQSDYSGSSQAARPAGAAAFLFPGESLNASRCLFALRRVGQLPAVLPSVPLPLLAQEVLQFAALLQLLVFLSQLQLLLLGCTTKKKKRGFTLN